MLFPPHGSHGGGPVLEVFPQKLGNLSVTVSCGGKTLEYVFDLNLKIKVVGGVHGNSQVEGSIVLDVNRLVQTYKVTPKGVERKTITALFDEDTGMSLTPEILKATVKVWLTELVKHGAFSDFENPYVVLSSLPSDVRPMRTGMDGSVVVPFRGGPAAGRDRR